MHEKEVNSDDEQIRTVEGSSRQTTRQSTEDENIIEVFDEETGTSIATRTLNSDGETHALGFDLMFNGIFDEEDRFHISGNADGKGDNRNLQNILDLQAVNYSH